MLNLSRWIDGWERRLDRLRTLLEIPEEESMTERSIAHGSFTVKRTYPVRPERIFNAWADPAIKGKWFGDPEKECVADVFDFSVGGRELRSGALGDGTTYAIDILYYDIVEDQRIVYAFDVEINGTRNSVSVAAITFEPTTGGTTLTITEHGAFLDGHESPIGREGGATFILDRLGALLAGDDKR
jgi:uncharacterized protein YndB with AHSA1/START domain